MKKITTTAGKTYAVTSVGGCNVYADEAGTQLIKTLNAGQDYFVAMGSAVWIDSDSAAVVECFNSAPQQRLALLGVLGGKLPEWFKPLKDELTALLDGSQFEVAWLADENTLVVHTDRVSDELLAAVKATAEAAMTEGAVLVQYNHNIEISWRDINKYAGFETMAALHAAYPDYKNDLTSDGEWIWPLTNLKSADKPLEHNHDYAFYGFKAKFAYFYIPRVESLGNFCNTASVIEVVIYAPNLQTGSYLFNQNGKMTKVSGNLDKLTTATYSFYTNSKLRVCEISFPSLSSGTYLFHSCQLDKPSALRVLNSIPAYTSGSHPLAIGIHVDHQSDEEVLEAIAEAENKGWTLTVQWNGTPTAQGASTMAFGKLIYAKASEIERPDGTTERVLGWGHYVTDETGYETFRSLASAYSYFGLPMPEEESQSTE